MPLRSVLPLILLLSLMACSGGDTAPAPTAPQAPPPPPQPAEGTPLAAEAFSFSVSLLGPLPQLTPGQMVEVPVVVRNTSPAAWPGDTLAPTLRPLSLSYHLYTQAGEKAVWDGARTKVTSTVPAGGEISLSMRLKAPDAPGSYLLEPDLVQDRVAWFAGRMKEGGPEKLPLEVRAAP